MRATARVLVQCQQPGAKTTEVEAHMATYFWFVLLQIWTVVEVTLGKSNHGMNGISKRQKFMISVQLICNSDSVSLKHPQTLRSDLAQLYSDPI